LVSLPLIIKPIAEKLARIADKKARLADAWVLTNMDPDKYKKLQSNLSKEEIRLKSLRADIDPSRLTELESVRETLEYWQNQFQSAAWATEDSGGGLKLLEKTKPAIRIAGLEGIGPMDCTTSPAIKRQIMNKLQVKLVVFHDRIEIRCQIPFETDRSVSVILTLGL
jgi:hypothetical protein